MVKRIILWKEKQRNKKLKRKLDGIRDKYRSEKERNRFLRKMLAAAYRENGILKDGYVVDWCDFCERQFTILWDPDKDGLMCKCPYCGKTVALCDSCNRPCDYEYGTGICGAGAREV